MTHPDPKCNEYQAVFLAKCSPDQRSLHELIFKVGNATFRYHQQARDFNPNEADWNEWLEGLDDPIKSAMKDKGFEECKSILAFTRYVMEKNDQGLDAYLKENLPPGDLEDYKKLVNG
jgi:hypothetical protein